MQSDHPPDFSSHSLHELRMWMQGINVNRRWPEYSLLIEEIARREHENPLESAQYRPGERMLTWFLLLMGIWFVWTFVSSLPRTIQTLPWVTTPCVVQESSVSGTETTGWKLQFAYEYTFQGNKLQSSQYSFRDNQQNMSYKSALFLSQKFPKGTHTICYVNPRNPREALLNKDWKLVNLLFLGLGIFFMRQAYSLFTYRRDVELVKLKQLRSD